MLRRPAALAIYKRQTQNAVKRFLCDQTSFPACIAALDAALGKLIQTLDAKDLPAFREVILANNPEQ